MKTKLSTSTILAILCALLVSFSCKNSQPDQNKLIEDLRLATDGDNGSLEKLLETNQGLILDEGLLKRFNASELLSKEGEYFSGLNFKIKPLRRLHNSQHDLLLCLKEFEAMDGRIAYLYVITNPLAVTNPQVYKLGSMTDVGNCGAGTDLTFKTDALMTDEVEKCYMENEETDEAGNLIRTVHHMLTYHGELIKLKRDTSERFVAID
ncbi:MAG: hypothetical protein MRZ79_02660 [Bacteroidia bacterium]|nr:hypothetical protein [Bacteroidia bacterium]